MTAFELQNHLSRLRLSQTEAAQLLGVSARTVRRWCEGEAVPGPAEAALRSWQRLEEAHLAWRPDSVSIEVDNSETIARHREHAIGLAEVLRRVEARGGPKFVWTVEIQESKATLGPMEVGFYKLQNGGFSCSVYTRRDIPPDLERDSADIEDAVFCIAQEFERAAQRAAALRAVAKAVGANSGIFGSFGPRLLDDDAKQKRRQLIEALAARIDRLGDRAAAGEPTTYNDFEMIYRELSAAGFSPPDRSLITAVARTHVKSIKKIRILFVKSGAHDDAVTKIVEAGSDRIESLIVGRKIKRLGLRLPVIGVSTSLGAFAGPDHVVIDMPAGVVLGDIDKPGLYLVENLHPSKVSAN